jgi:hypothetical protein
LRRRNASRPSSDAATDAQQRPVWIAWAFSPEHIVIAMVGAAVALAAVIALGFVMHRLWRGANERLDEVAEPASALKTDWWLCPVCGSFNRPHQRCCKGCATTAGQVLPLRAETSRDKLLSSQAPKDRA